MEHLNGALPLVIGGKAVTLFFDYTFVSILSGLTGGSDIDTILANEPMRAIPLIALAALKAGDDVNDLAGLETERQVSRALSGISPDDNAKIMECFKHSMGFIGAVFGGVTSVAASVEDAKGKKSTGTN